MVLPSFGGTAAVWTTSVLFFQLVLLLGYLYTHVATNRLVRSRQVPVHLGLMLVPLLFLPVAVVATPAGGGVVDTVTRLLLGLAAGVGVPYLVVSTSGPLLQRWFSWTDHADAPDPYFLYAASNVGSIAGLVGYLVLVEPLLDLHAQAFAWSIGYAILMLLVLACAWALRWADAPLVDSGTGVGGSKGRHDGTVTAAPPSSSAVGRPLVWVGLAFLPSSLMLGVTTFLTVDIAPVPLLWVVPLTLYLLTFVVAFGTRSGAGATWALRLVAPLTLLGALGWLRQVAIPVTVVLVLASFGCLAMVVHARLADTRPPADELTGFYVWVAVGGALGGVFNGIVAPALFSGPWEFALVLGITTLVVGRSLGELVGSPSELRFWTTIVALAGGMVGLGILATRAPDQTVLVVAGLIAMVVYLLVSPAGQSQVAVLAAVMMLALPPAAAYLGGGVTTRSFFGSYRVAYEDDLRVLYSGTTLHGMQSLSDPAIPLSYYHPDGPVGDFLPVTGPDQNLGFIGLGAGSLAAYSQPGQLVRFHEIDPTVVRLAQNYFTFLSDAEGEVDIVLGDGRLSLEEVPTDGYDVIVVDAFTSDSIPVHLLTVEAFEAYDRVVAPDGVVLVHVSNRYLDLEPVVTGSATAIGLEGRTGRVDASDDGLRAASIWMALSHDAQRLGALDPTVWRSVRDEAVAWTDDKSNILDVLKGVP